MSNGSMPEYDYHPANGGDNPKIRTVSNKRARLFTGGTYFRAREPGIKGNNISIQALEFISQISGEEGELRGKLVITNHNTEIAENITGPVNVKFLNQELNWNERYVIDNLITSPRLLRYFSSFETSPIGLILQEDMGRFIFSRLCHTPNKFSVMLELLPVVPLNSVITIKPRTRVYDLEYITIIDEPLPGPPPTTPPNTTSGWDIVALRTIINANDPWVEMLERSGTEAGGIIGMTPKFDAQDDGLDDKVLSLFPDTFLMNGNGLPRTPIQEQTGPTRSLIHVNYGEQYNGVLTAINTVYEWVSSDNLSGEWVKY